MTASIPDYGVQSVVKDNYKKQSLLAALFFLVALMACFYETAWSIVAIWMRSDTYAHGFLIIPIVLWLAWGRRVEFYSKLQRPEFLSLVPLAACGFAWLSAQLVDVLVVQQFALVGMIIAGLWAILGRAACQQIAFPLAYLLFLVPVGEGLVPPMMEFTATFTVAMIQLTGIPVYREGLFFILPTGSWSVVEACSGVRYLIASVALGCLYAYLNYRSLWRRALFILVAIVVPIIANGLRAYIIVMLGHMSDMTIATGVDHLIYGWVFFGLVMFLLFYVGSFWQQNWLDDDSATSMTADSTEALKNTSVYSVVILSLMVVPVWPLLAWSIQERESEGNVQVDMPAEIADWRLLAEPAVWNPQDGGAKNTRRFTYAKGDMSIQMIIQPFQGQDQGAELVAGRDLLLPQEGSWRVASRGKNNTVNSILRTDVNEAQLMNALGKRYLVWHWYRVGDSYTSNDYRAKLLEVQEKLTFGRQDSARIYISAEYLGDDVENARLGLISFLKQGAVPIAEQLDQAFGVD